MCIDSRYEEPKKKANRSKNAKGKSIHMSFLKSLEVVVRTDNEGSHVSGRFAMDIPSTPITID
jgi:hypothetical protein